MKTNEVKDLVKPTDKHSADYDIGYANGYARGYREGGFDSYNRGLKVGMKKARERFNELNPNYKAR